MDYNFLEYVYLGVWALIGSTLGFFAFVYTPSKSPQENLSRGVLSISIGLFLALAILIYIDEMHNFSKLFNIMVSGLGAFGLPDFILKWWPKLVQGIANYIVEKILWNHNKPYDFHNHDHNHQDDQE